MPPRLGTDDIQVLRLVGRIAIFQPPSEKITDDLSSEAIGGVDARNRIAVIDFTERLGLRSCDTKADDLRARDAVFARRLSSVRGLVVGFCCLSHAP